METRKNWEKIVVTKKKMENILAEELKRRFDQSPNPKYDKIFVSKRPFQAKSLKKMVRNL